MIIITSINNASYSYHMKHVHVQRMSKIRTYAFVGTSLVTLMLAIRNHRTSKKKKKKEKKLMQQPLI